MPDFTALIIGCGTIGAATARLALEGGRFQQVIVADRDVARASQLADALGSPAAALQLDYRQEDQLAKSLKSSSP